MKSHLTRRVFRSILANEPIVHRGCLRRRTFGTARASFDPKRANVYHQHDRSILQPPQRRTFFEGMFGGQKKNAKEADIDPGLEVMQDLERLKQMRARLPLPEDVADAVTAFFSTKFRRRQAPTDSQARLAYESIRYCLDSGEGTEANKMMQTPSLLRNAADVVLLVKGQQPGDSHAHLALLLHEITQKYEIKGRTANLLPATAYVVVLAHTGRSDQARDFVRSLLPSDKAHDLELKDDNVGDSLGGKQRHQLENFSLSSRNWRWVMLGFAREGKGQDLLDTLEEIKGLGLDAERIASPAMLEYNLQGDDREAVGYWFRKCLGLRREEASWETVTKTRAITISRVLSWCFEHDQPSLGHEIVRNLLADNPPKLYWDAILVWAARNGKGADEINRMLGVMEASNDTATSSDERVRPDIATINGLVEFAIAKNDPYLAERFIAIGKERNIQPDARTFVLQMQYRLKVQDIDGALIAYTNLQSMDISDNEDVPTVNQLIVALCNSKRHDFDTIMNVAADLSDRRVQFQPSTVSALALLHLNRDEVHDVLDLLNTHAHRYASIDRTSIRQTILEFCLDPKTPTSRAWDGYTILRSIFDEMPRSQRTELMVSFFERGRPDMATHIFSGMRTHSRADTIPTVDTYVAAFLACARLRDLEVLEVIHNQLKLDYNINPTTYLYNALIIGYTASGKPRRALEFWDDIVASKEGPTYNSIHIALRACEKAAFGDVKAQEIWRRLRKSSVDLDQSLWASYAAALVGNGDIGLAINTIEEAESNGEVEVDAYLVGSLITGCPGQAKQEEIEVWAQEKHPQVWTELEKIGIESDEVGLRTVKIDRAVAP